MNLWNHSLFSRAYWKDAALQLKKPRVLAVCALLLAVSIAMSGLFLQLPNNLRVYFTYLPKGLCAAVCGPVAALVAGFAEDLLGYALHPSGGFFPGYTLSTMVGMFLYALGFYRQRLSLPRVALTKLSVNLLCNVGLGTLWSSILYGKSYLFYFWGSLGKNLLLWPVEVFLMMAVFRLLAPAMAKEGLLVPQGPTKK